MNIENETAILSQLQVLDEGKMDEIERIDMEEREKAFQEVHTNMNLVHEIHSDLARVSS